MSVAYTQHYLFVLPIDLVECHVYCFRRLGGSVLVRHLVESKMAHARRADELQVKWVSEVCRGT
jgi:hypothetical protein